MIFPFSFLTGGKSKKGEKERNTLEINKSRNFRATWLFRHSCLTHWISKLRDFEGVSSSREIYDDIRGPRMFFFFFFYWENPKAKATSWKAALCGRLGERGFEFSKGTQRALDATTAMVRNDSFEDKLHTFLRFFFLSFLFNVYLKMHFLMRKYRQWDKWKKKRMIR